MNDNLITSEYDFKENKISDFISLGKSSFNFNGQKELFWDRNKRAADILFYSENKSISGLFISIENAVEFPLYSIPFNLYLNNFVKSRILKADNKQQFEEIQDLYKKWVANELPEEKRFFGLSILNITEKSSHSNFIFYLYSSIIYIFDPSLKNQEKALFFIKKTQENILDTKLKEHVQNDFLELLDLYTAFLYFSGEEIIYSEHIFDSILEKNSFSITALFYKIYMEIRIRNFDSAAVKLKEILDFDFNNIQQTIRKCNLEKFIFFSRNSVIMNLFYNNEFSPIFEELLGMVQKERNYSGYIDLLIELISNPPELKIVTKENDELNLFLAFAKSLLENKEKNNYFFLRAIPEIALGILEKSKNCELAIKNIFDEKIRENLAVFDDNLVRSVKELQELEELFSQEKNGLGEKQKKEVANEENNCTLRCKDIEDRIRVLQYDNHYSAVSSFKNIMLVNTMISFSISILGGCAGFNYNHSSSFLDMENSLSSILYTALKWGIYTFLSGFVISVIFSFWTIIKKLNSKQRLSNLLKRTTNNLEIQKQRILSHYQNKETRLTNSYNNKKEEISKRMEKIKKNKLEMEESLKEGYANEINKASLPLYEVSAKLAIINQLD